MPMPHRRRRGGVVPVIAGGCRASGGVGLVRLEREVVMSTDPLKPGGKVELERLAAESAKLIDEAVAEEREAEQEDLFEPFSSEEVLEASEELGPKAGALSIARHIRDKRKAGRPKGAKNRVNRDVQAYLRQFGPDPAVVMMRILAESEEEMVERSKRIDPVKKQLSFSEARGMRIRCAEGVRKIFHGDQPVQVDHTIQGVRIIQEMGDRREAQGVTIDGRPKVLPFEDGEGDS